MEHAQVLQNGRHVVTFAMIMAAVAMYGMRRYLKARPVKVQVLRDLLKRGN